MRLLKKLRMWEKCLRKQPHSQMEPSCWLTYRHCLNKQKIIDFRPKEAIALESGKPPSWGSCHAKRDGRSLRHFEIKSYFVSHAHFISRLSRKFSLRGSHYADEVIRARGGWLKMLLYISIHWFNEKQSLSQLRWQLPLHKGALVCGRSEV